VPLAIVGGLEDIMSAMEARYPSVAAHCRRVSLYAVRLATQYGLPTSTIETIRVGALLHDLGKLEVPERILEKPGRLTEREWARLRNHPEAGLALVQRLGFDEAVAEIVLYHHERIDGSGYPDSLAAEAIPWAVRIVSVMDAFDALTSPRAYRAALSLEAARALLAREAGSRYCPWVVSGLLSLPRVMLQHVEPDHRESYLPDSCPGMAALSLATKAWTPAGALLDHDGLSAGA
jgi:putative nucleotidyltransferase with HDIG domain